MADGDNKISIVMHCCINLININVARYYEFDFIMGCDAGLEVSTGALGYDKSRLYITLPFSRGAMGCRRVWVLSELTNIHYIN